MRIDRHEIRHVDPPTLLPDAQFKGYVEVVVQDVVFTTDNVLFRKEKFYAPSAQRTAPDVYVMDFNNRTTVGGPLLGRVAHRLGPDVESASPARGDLPQAPDPLAFVVPPVGYVVLAEIALGPPALSVIDLVSTADQEWADHVAPFAGHHSLAKRQVELHLMPAGDQRLQKETNPGTTGETGIGLEIGRLNATHSGLLLAGLRRSRRTQS